MNETRIYNLLGICQKGRNVISGEFSVKQAVLNQEAHLVIVSKDASQNTKKLFHDKCSYREIPCIEWGTRDLLGQCLGKEERVVIGLLDEKLAEKIAQMIQIDG